MPPIPPHGSSYPPSTSSSNAYQPLNTFDQDDIDEGDLESSYPSSSSISFSDAIRERSFFLSPYQSAANDPTEILKSFLAETRTRQDPDVPKTRNLKLRITTESRSKATKTVELPLPALSDQDSLPFALADDVPCRRGLPQTGPSTWRTKMTRWIASLKQPDRRRNTFHRLDIRKYQDPLNTLTDTSHLQVWNNTQSKPLYASADEVERLRNRLKRGISPPWAALNDLADASLPTQAASQSSANPNGQGNGNARFNEPLSHDDDLDEDLTNPYNFNPLTQSGDLDLSVFFKRKRSRKASRLVSVGLQESIERFADDRSFSKWLICREEVWGWDWMKLQQALVDLLDEGSSKPNGNGKGKSKQVEEGIVGQTIIKKIQVLGLEPGPIIRVVWSPLPSIEKLGFLGSKASLIGLICFIPIISILIFFGFVTNTLLILLAILLAVTWISCTYLIRTNTDAVYDNIGTAWCLAPKWVPLDVPQDWTEDQVRSSLKDAKQGSPFTIDDQTPTATDASDHVQQPRLKKTDQGWFHLQGMTEHEWIHKHKDQILHALR